MKPNKLLHKPPTSYQLSLPQIKKPNHPINFPHKSSHSVQPVRVLIAPSISSQLILQQANLKADSMETSRISKLEGSNSEINRDKSYFNQIKQKLSAQIKALNIENKKHNYYIPNARDDDNDIELINEFSQLATGARYELLNANKLLIDYGVKMGKSNTDNLLASQIIDPKILKNPVNMMKDILKDGVHNIQ